MKKFSLHFAVINTQTGKKSAYRTSIADTPDAAVSQAVDYVETNWGPMETEETGIDTYTWEVMVEGWVDVIAGHTNNVS